MWSNVDAQGFDGVRVGCYRARWHFQRVNAYEQMPGWVFSSDGALLCAIVHAATMQYPEWSEVKLSSGSSFIVLSVWAQHKWKNCPLLLRPTSGLLNGAKEYRSKTISSVSLSAHLQDIKQFDDIRHSLFSVIRLHILDKTEYRLVPFETVIFCQVAPAALVSTAHMHARCPMPVPKRNEMYSNDRNSGFRSTANTCTMCGVHSIQFFIIYHQIAGTLGRAHFPSSDRLNGPTSSRAAVDVVLWKDSKSCFRPFFFTLFFISFSMIKWNTKICNLHFEWIRLVDVKTNIHSELWMDLR